MTVVLTWAFSNSPDIFNPDKIQMTKNLIVTLKLHLTSSFLNMLEGDTTIKGKGLDIPNGKREWPTSDEGQGSKRSKAS
jgi:hypothetical protein